MHPEHRPLCGDTPPHVEWRLRTQVKVVCIPQQTGNDIQEKYEHFQRLQDSTVPLVIEKDKKAPEAPTWTKMRSWPPVVLENAEEPERMREGRRQDTVQDRKRGFLCSFPTAGTFVALNGAAGANQCCDHGTLKPRTRMSAVRHSCR
ncbi:hypothetical protein NDU88_002233 [Pleurodeles waltl]|uniref:Uncharacterized protein n=1 Tax=Pleurodeles waltl TaxID=8319 RepID=A0AAV7VE03_PLEWA|nr:hypothetical protein NDU88_002233 [Pleurodeles waltl]